MQRYHRWGVEQKFTVQFDSTVWKWTAATESVTNVEINPSLSDYQVWKDSCSVFTSKANQSLFGSGLITTSKSGSWSGCLFAPGFTWVYSHQHKRSRPTGGNKLWFVWSGLNVPAVNTSLNLLTLSVTCPLFVGLDVCLPMFSMKPLRPSQNCWIHSSCIAFTFECMLYFSLTSNPATVQLLVVTWPQRVQIFFCEDLNRKGSFQIKREQCFLAAVISINLSLFAASLGFCSNILMHINYLTNSVLWLIGEPPFSHFLATERPQTPNETVGSHITGCKDLSLKLDN